MRILSGIQPSGQLHLGNYFGSMKPNIDRIGSADESVYFIADLHSLTTVSDPKILAEYRKNALIDILACGLDHKKATIFYQSDVPAHAELMWILSTLTPMGLLERAVSYKDKVEKGIAASVGLFTYPVLMAADILLYNATHVPVGKDQKQHLEMARDIATKFNNQYSETFILPEPVIAEEVAVVPGTDGQKMSKSYGNTIPLFGDEKAIKKAIMGITTDSKGMTDPKDPETCVIYQLHRHLLDKNAADALADEYRSGLPYGDAKKRFLEAYIDYFAPMRRRREELAANEDRLQSIIEEGTAKALEMSEATMSRVKAAVGLQ